MSLNFPLFAVCWSCVAVALFILFLFHRLRLATKIISQMPFVLVTFPLSLTLVLSVTPGLSPKGQICHILRELSICQEGSCAYEYFLGIGYLKFSPSSSS